MRGLADDFGGLADMIDIVAFRLLELLDDDGDVVLGGERPHALEQVHELDVGLVLGPAIAQGAGTAAAEHDEFPLCLFEAAERGFGPREDLVVIGLRADASQVGRADEAVACEDAQRRGGKA